MSVDNDPTFHDPGPFPIVPGERDADYLGDGIYISFDGYSIILRTPRAGRWEEMSIDPETWAKLNRFAVDHFPANKRTAAPKPTN